MEVLFQQCWPPLTKHERTSDRMCLNLLQTQCYNSIAAQLANIMHKFDKELIQRPVEEPCGNDTLLDIKGIPTHRFHLALLHTNDDPKEKHSVPNVNIDWLACTTLCWSYLCIQQQPAMTILVSNGEHTACCSHTWPQRTCWHELTLGILVVQVPVSADWHCLVPFPSLPVVRCSRFPSYYNVNCVHCFSPITPGQFCQGFLFSP